MTEVMRSERNLGCVHKSLQLDQISHKGNRGGRQVKKYVHRYKQMYLNRSTNMWAMCVGALHRQLRGRPAAPTDHVCVAV